eukprot:gene15537-biopygen7533
MEVFSETPSNWQAWAHGPAHHLNQLNWFNCATKGGHEEGELEEGKIGAMSWKELRAACKARGLTTNIAKTGAHKKAEELRASLRAFGAPTSEQGDERGDVPKNTWNWLYQYAHLPQLHRLGWLDQCPRSH